MPAVPAPASGDREVVEAWQCIGCGKVDAPRPCIGVCKDRKVRLVDVIVLERSEAEATALRARIAELERALDRLARVTPRPGAWETSYRAMQVLARALLGRRPAA